MSLTVGTRLGAYEILSLIGSGGMGEVYRAKDTKLGRDVAIKVLPTVSNMDAARLARFEREARLLAALNHPHIAAIYGFEQQGGVHALVLELVDGETLADRVSRGPMPIVEALAIARQVADALDAAHSQGIVHRDLKPANIVLARQGVVKLLDFGLAKSEAVGTSTGSTQSPTMLRTTADGVLLGTAPYMSPEQTRGHPVDKRTDIWGFGCVLYELITGRRAFAAATTPDTMVAILEREPDWTRLPTATPPTVRRLIRRCLEKDPNARLRDIGDARAEIDDVLDERRVWSRQVAMVAGLLSLVALAAVLWFSITRRPTPVTVPSEYVQLTNVTDAAVSPSLSLDGRLLAFKRGAGAFLDAGQIYVKPLPNGDAVRLTDDPRPKYGPVFTPDGSRIAYTQFTSEGTSVSWDTWTVPVLGGAPTRLLPNASGLGWLPSGLVLFSEITSGLHMQVVTATESRMSSRVVYSPVLEMGMAHYSSPSPDSRAALIVEMGKTHTFDSPCRLVPLDGSSAGHIVGPAGMCYSAAWSPDGRWMYFAANVGGHSHLWRQQVPNGAPEQITFGTTEEEGLAISHDGRSLITSVGRRESAIWLHDSTGDRAITSEGYATDPRWSSEGTKVFYRDAGTATASNPIGPAPPGDLRVLDVKAGKTDTVLPGVAVTDYDLSPDSRDVVFTTTKEGESQLWIEPVNRSASPRLLARSADQPSFAGRETIVFRDTANTAPFLSRIKVDGSGRERVVMSPIVEKYGASPNGEWVAAVVPLTKDDNRLPDPLAVPYDTMAIPMRGGPMKKLCNGACRVSWSVDGTFLYVFAGQTLVLPIAAGQSLPELPASGISVGDVPNDLPVKAVIAESSVVSRSDPSTYLFTRVELRANLFRIPLH